MSLTPGTRLGPYEIQSALGAGGMGEVYRARDSRLGRDVAIKVLPAGIADPERLARFAQEARAAAALNHPNILAVYDFGTHPSTGSGQAAPYIVTELLEGETLRERLVGGALPVRKAVEYAAQIANGLAAAHEKGIVHRDLKPENVFVTATDRVKILDFGLAKLIEAEPVAARGSMLPTCFPDTMPGVVLGTVGYMAPEQVRGTAADHRCDIFAFGALLYEMLSGRRAFARETSAETMTAILREEPAALATPEQSVPPSLDRLVRRCLEKNPAARFQSALDLAFALESLDAASGTASGTAAVPVVAGRRLRRERVAWIVAASCLLVAVAAGGVAYLRDTPDERTLRFTIAPPDGWRWDAVVDATSLLGVSPDGRNLAFVARNAQGRTLLWLRPFDTLEARPLVGTDGARALFWSPDGRWLGFLAEGKLKKIGVASGGAPVTVCDAPGARDATWGADDEIVFSQAGTGLQKVSAAGGAPAAVTTLSANEQAHNRPVFLPDGRHFLYGVNTLERSGGTEAQITRRVYEVYAAALDSPDRTPLLTTESLNILHAQGHLLFLRGSTLVAQPFDSNRLALTGEPVPIAEQVGSVTAYGGQVVFNSLRSGALELYRKASSGAGTEELLLKDGRSKDPNHWSPDGRWVAYTSDESGQPEVYVAPFPSGEGKWQVSTAGGEFPRWRGDGRELYYLAAGNTLTAVAVAGTAAAFQAGAPQHLFKVNLPPGPGYPYDVTPDGQRFLFNTEVAPPPPITVVVNWMAGLR